MAVYNAFVLIALDLVTRDRLHDLWQEDLWIRMAALVAGGSLLSYFAAVALDIDGPNGRIAVASALAFAAGGALDALVYHLSRALPWLERSNRSNVAGAAGDSIVFQTVAFAWSWPLIFAQFTAKVAGGIVWSLLLEPRRR